MGLGNITTPLDPDKAYVALEVIIGLFSALGNMFVLLVFVCHPNIRTVTNYYVISLSLADSLVGLFGVPFSIVNSIGIPANFEACLFMNCLLMVLCTSSIFSLVSLALDRYWAITRPLNYKQHMTSRNSLTVISVSWLLATFIGLIPLLGWNLGRPIVPRCFFLEVMDPTYLLFVYLSTIILPTLFIAGIYMRIYIAVRKHLRELPKHNTAPGYPKLMYSKAEAKAAKSLSIIVMLFAVSWIPLYTMNAVIYFCPTCFIPEYLVKSLILLSHANSLWNPGLYAWGLADFRAVLRKMFLFRKKKYAVETQTAQAQQTMLMTKFSRTDL